MTRPFSLSRRAILGGFVATLALSACSQVRYTAPEPNLPERFAPDSPARRAGTNARWAAFQDRNLDRLVAAGLARNLDVQQAVASVRAAQANARLMGASDLPRADLEAAASRGDNGTGASVAESSSTTLGVSWLIDLFGANEAARAGARASLDAAYLSTEVARLTIASAIASAYVDLRYYQEALSLTRQSLESRRRSLAMTREQAELGSGKRLDVLQAEQLVAQAEAALPAMEAGFEQAANRLATLTNGSSAQIRSSLSRGSGQPRARYRASVGVRADVIRVRPDVHVAERRLAEAAAKVGEARAAFYPKLTLSGSVTPTDLSGGGSRTTWGLGPQISVPLFDGGQCGPTVRSPGGG